NDGSGVVLRDTRTGSDNLDFLFDVETVRFTDGTLAITNDDLVFTPGGGDTLSTAESDLLV
ncbi:MAG: hypothetical protein AAGD23_12845, partial [Pseudomonadota bacterium]